MHFPVAAADLDGLGDGTGDESCSKINGVLPGVTKNAHEVAALQDLRHVRLLDLGPALGLGKILGEHLLALGLRGLLHVIGSNLLARLHGHLRLHLHALRYLHLGRNIQGWYRRRLYDPEVLRERVTDLRGGEFALDAGVREPDGGDLPLVEMRTFLRRVPPAAPAQRFDHSVFHAGVDPRALRIVEHVAQIRKQVGPDRLIGNAKRRDCVFPALVQGVADRHGLRQRRGGSHYGHRQRRYPSIGSIVVGRVVGCRHRFSRQKENAGKVISPYRRFLKLARFVAAGISRHFLP